MKAKKILAGVLASALTLTAGLVPAGTSVFEMTRMGMTAYADEIVEPATKPGVSIENIKVPCGTTQADLGIYAISEEVNSVEMYISMNSPLEFENLTGYFACETEVDSSIHAIYVTGTGTPFSPDKPFGTISVSVDPNAEPGTYPVNIKINNIGGDNGSFTDYTIINGSVTIDASMPQRVIGDINDSGDIDLHDPIIVAEYLIGLRELTNNEYKFGDFNQDGKIDLYDAISMSMTIFKEETSVVGTTQVDGGIVLSDTEIETGSKTAEVPVYISKGVSSKGAVVKYNVPDGFELTKIRNALATENTKAVYASGSEYESGKPLDTLSITVPDSVAVGEYPITAEIFALDDANGGYYANPTVTTGTIRVVAKGSSDSSTKPGISISDVVVSYGTTSATLGLYTRNAEIDGIDINIIAQEPLLIERVEGAMISGSNSEVVNAVFFSASAYDPEKAFGTVYVSIAPGTKPGTYPINLEIRELGGNGKDITDYAAVNGSITIEEPTSEEPTEAPDEPVITPSDDIIYDNNFDTTEKGVGIESVSVPYGTTEVKLGLYMLNVNSSRVNMAFELESPLSVEKTDAYLEQEENGKYYVIYVDSNGYDTDRVFGTVTLSIDKDTEPGTYPVVFTINELDDNVGSVSAPVAVCGNVTIREPEAEEPTEEPEAEEPTEEPEAEEPTEEPELPQTGNNAPANFVIAVSALIIAVAGAFVMMKSGIIIRKKESK